MQYIKYILIAVMVVVMIVMTVINAKRKNAIKTGGVETDAVVTRVTEDVSTDADGSISDVSHTYYVTYRAMNGLETEAKLVSGNSVDFHFGNKGWDSDLYEGCRVRIKYLPENPGYVVRVL